MRSTLRSLAFGIAGLLSAGAMAQQPYYWVISGVVVPCYQGQTVNVQTINGTLPVINIDIPVDSNNCTFSTILALASQQPVIQLSTQCGGAIQTLYDGTSFNFLMDTVYTSYTINCNGSNLDCNGIPNGPSMPGTPCNDGDSLTVNDTWGMNCVCSGSTWVDCLGILNGTNIVGSACDDGDTLTVNDIWNVSCICDGDSGNFFNFDCLGVLNGPAMPGTACDDLDSLTVNDTWNANCGCTGTPLGGQYDCLGVLNGNAQPGTACTDTLNGAIFTGLWTANCICADTTNFLTDCLGIPFGPNMPGTPCNDGDSLTVQDTWNSACICAGVFLNAYDCNNVLNGPDMPGAPCNDNDPNTSNDMWDANCDCVGSNNSPCQAGFWVFQGYTVDSLNGPQPIPNELWIWNLSTGGSGTYSFLWSFGDGTSSTDPFPTHQYANGGPYVLCLTIDDGAGCTSTSCDSISVDSNGMYTGFTGGGGQRLQGFTINVQNQVAQGVADHTIAEGIATWPNPATDELNIALSDAQQGQVYVTVTDANGRLMMNEKRSLLDGRNQMRISTDDLAPGLYLLRIANGKQAISQRFVKAN